MRSATDIYWDAPPRSLAHALEAPGQDARTRGPDNDGSGNAEQHSQRRE